MIVKRFLLVGKEGVEKWLNSPINLDDTHKFLRGEWDRPNEMRLIYFKDIILVERFKFSKLWEDREIGELIEQGEVVKNIYGDDVYYWDNRYWYTSFGKTVVFTKDCVAVFLFLKGDARINTLNTNTELIFKQAAQTVLTEMGIETELYKSDLLAAGSRDKMGCGFSRMSKKTPEEVIRHEAGWITYYYDHDVFASILPDVELYREGSSDPNQGVITGIENIDSNFNREEFEDKWILEIAKIIEENPIIEIQEEVVLE